MKKVFSRCSLL